MSRRPAAAHVTRTRMTAACLVAVCQPAVACRAPDAGTAGVASAAVDSTFTVAGRRVPPELLNRHLAEREGFTSRGGAARCAYVPLGEDGDRLFVHSLCLELVPEAESLAVGSGRAGPVAFRVAADGGAVRVLSHDVPADGGGHAASVRRIFPPAVVARIAAMRADRAAHDALGARLRTRARHDVP